MAEDRKKMLEALVAKRKAEAEGGGRSAHKSKSSSLISKPASAHKSSPLLHKPKPKPSSPLLQKQKHQHHKKESPPKKKKKRVEKYDTEEDEDEDGDDSDEDSDSEDEPVKKKVPASKGGSAAKPSSLKSSPFKGNQDTKGKTGVKEAAKGKRKSKDSSDDDDVGSGDEDEEAAEADSGDEGLDTTNILPSRTRRTGTQAVHYDFTNMSGDDDDDDSD